MTDLHRLAPPFIICFCAGALYGWSALAQALQTRFDLRMADTGLVFSLALVAFTCAVIAAPYIGARTGHMRLLAWAAGLGAICTALAAVAPSFALFALLFSVGFGAMSGAIYCTALGMAATSPAAWIATPVMVAGFGLGGAVFGPLWRVLAYEGWGLAALLPLAIALALAGLLGASVSALRDPTAPKLIPPLSRTPLPRRRLALIWLVFATGTFGGLMVLGMAAKIMDASGSAMALAGMVLASVAIANTLGRLSAAGFSPRSRAMAGLSVSCAVSLIGLAVAAFGATPSASGVGLVLIAAGYGLMASAIPLVTARAVEPAQFQRAFGIVFTAWGAAGFTAPWLTGLLYDLRGDFSLGYACAAGVTALCLPLIWALRRALTPAP